MDARGEVGKDEGGEIFVVEEEEGEEDSVVGCVCKTVGWDDIDVELFSVGPVLAGDKELLISLAGVAADPGQDRASFCQLRQHQQSLLTALLLVENISSVVNVDNS